MGQLLLLLLLLWMDWLPCESAVAAVGGLAARESVIGAAPRTLFTNIFFFPREVGCFRDIIPGRFSRIPVVLKISYLFLRIKCPLHG